MKANLLALMVCPLCEGTLALRAEEDRAGDIALGELACRTCHASYPIADGLPVILDRPSGVSRGEFSDQWRLRHAGFFETDTLYGKTAQEELDAFLRIFGIGDAAALEGKRILDAGCGSGRLTALLAEYAPSATVVGIDICDAARWLQRVASAMPNLHVIQCDLVCPPLRKESFDYVWSEGVLHHTADSRVSFHKLASLLRRDGKLYVWVYARYRFSVMRSVRRLLVRAHQLPWRLRYALSWLIGIPLFAAARAAARVGATGSSHGLKSIVFALYDNLSPKYQHAHSREEVREWFEENGFSDICILGDLGVTARKL